MHLELGQRFSAKNELISNENGWQPHLIIKAVNTFSNKRLIWNVRRTDAVHILPLLSHLPSAPTNISIYLLHFNMHMNSIVCVIPTSSQYIYK